MKGKLEKFIDSHNEAFNHRSPNPLVLERIKLQMQTESPKKPKKGIVISFQALRWTAAACFLLVLGAVFWKLNESNTPVDPKMLAKTAVKTHPQVPTNDTGKNSPVNEVAQQSLAKEHHFEEIDEDIASRKAQMKRVLGENASASYKQVLFDQLGDQESPAKRIQVLSGTGRLKNMSRDVVDVLVQTMNDDPNTNVRLAALDGLAKFYKESYVKKQLISSLKKQQDPMVQIALIGLLTRMKESAILSELEQMVRDKDTMDAVKERAYTSMFELKGT